MSWKVLWIWSGAAMNSDKSEGCEKAMSGKELNDFAETLQAISLAASAWASALANLGPSTKVKSIAASHGVKDERVITVQQADAGNP